MTLPSAPPSPTRVSATAIPMRATSRISPSTPRSRVDRPPPILERGYGYDDSTDTQNTLGQPEVREGEPPIGTGPAGEPPNRPDWTRFTWAIPVVILFWVLSLIHVPYFVLSPGPAADVEPRIHVTGHATFQSKGHLLLTSVFESVQTITVYDAIHAWLSPAEELVPARDILAPGEPTT